MKKLTSVQRRLLREQEELELDIPDDYDIGDTKKGKSEPELEPKAKPETDELDEMPIEGDDIDAEDTGEDTDLDDIKDIEDTRDLGGDDTIDAMTKAIDELEDMRSNMNKKGILVAMKLNDFSTQKRLQTLADELGSIIAGLNDKMLKTIAKSPESMQQATSWLSGESEQ